MSTSTEDTPNYHCRRINSEVFADSINDLLGRVFVGCQYYTNWDLGTSKYLCQKHFPNNRRCLVKLAVQREKSELSHNL